MNPVRIGMIGSGYIGKIHAVAYSMASTIFPGVQFVKHLVAEKQIDLVEKTSKDLGFYSYTENWEDLVRDPKVEVVDICTPDFLHKEMALGAIREKKIVYCEKPLTLNLSDTKILLEEANRAQIPSLVGYNYVKNLAVKLSKEIIESGEIGEIIHFTGRHNEDAYIDPRYTFMWKFSRKRAGSGALLDLGSHVMSLALYLLSGVESVVGDMQIVVSERLDSDGKMRKVENADQVQALLRFESGACGEISMSRVATGRKWDLSYQITGTKGSIYFTQERMNELKVYSSAYNTKKSEGFKTILMGTAHGEYSYFCPVSGHGLGYNDLKAIEVKDLYESLRLGKELWPNFEFAYQVSRVLEAIDRSSETRSWVKISDIT